MANNVNFWIEFYEINDEAKDRLQQLFQNAEIQSDGEISFSELIKQDVPREEKDYEWNINNVGPKWCHIEEHYDNIIQGSSAWVEPVVGLNKLLEDLTTYDPNMITVISYDDEASNFIGTWVYEGNEVVDGEDLDWSDVVQQIIEDYDEFGVDDYDFESGEWIDEETQQSFWDVQWEWISDKHDELRTTIISKIKGE